MNKYEEHLNRVLSAVSLESVDRIPYISSGSAVNAAISGISLATYCSDMVKNCDANLRAHEVIGEADGAQVMVFNPKILSTCWLSEVKIPGCDLSDNELWQMNERELVKQEDYDEIIEGGFAPWYQKFLVEKFNNPLAQCRQYFEYFGTSIGRFVQAGIPCFCGAIFYTPIEMFCGGRSLESFLTEDIFEIPEKVEEVFKLTQEFNLNNYKNMLHNPAGKPLAVWIGGWRGTPSMLSPEMFEKYSWKYMMEIAELTLEAGVIPLFHLDSNWNRGMKYFKQLPKGKCILALDGETDIFKAKEVVGDHCCLMGDVPASLLAFGSVDDVKDYCKKLIKEVGPKGYILSTGCDAPFNSKLENLQAMAHSVFEYR